MASENTNTIQGVKAENRIYTLRRITGKYGTAQCRSQKLFEGAGSEFRKDVLRRCRLEASHDEIMSYVPISARFYETVWASPENVPVCVAIGHDTLGGHPVFLLGEWKRQ